MPELPEVETVRRGLEQLILGRTIQAVRITYPRLAVTGAEELAAELPGQTIQAMARRGKYLIFDLGRQVLISHLRMEGKYLLFAEEPPANKHFHAFFELDTGETLVYQDVRKFGTLELLEKTELEAYFRSKKLGPEPTEEAFGLADFRKKLARSRKPVKSHLLDQSLVAGLGNIYADEVLWAAKIHPERPSASLTAAEAKRLRREIIRILQLGIDKGGSTIRTYKNSLGEDGTMQDFLQVYGQPGQPCARCATPIEKTVVGGRGTHYCPRCQKR